jgi:hypothetical protein
MKYPISIGNIADDLSKGWRPVSFVRVAGAFMRGHEETA